MQGGEESIHAWFSMIGHLIENGLPVALAATKQNEFQQSIIEYFGSDKDSWNTTQEELKEALDFLEKNGKVQRVEPYNEYAWSEKSELFTHEESSDLFFVSNMIDHHSLQYVRSRVQTFCQLRGIAQSAVDEIVISATEAAENAIKYSDGEAFYVLQKVEDGRYNIQMTNSVSSASLDDEAARGKFSADVSLMRGVLVMSRLLDDLTIDRNTEKNLVCFEGVKTI